MKKVYIGKSKIAGRGLFAGENIRKGDFILPLRGTLIHKEYRRVGKYRNEQTWIPVSLHRWIRPISPIRFLNHSCEPNAGFKTPTRLYASRDIAQDQEIVVDYSTIEYLEFWQSPCNCGSKHCRRIIRAIQFLKPKTYKSYLPYIPKFLRDVYEDRHQAV